MRRYLLGAALSFSVAASITGCSSSTSTIIPGPHPTSAPASPIQHVIIMMQENRSFNNIFAGFPGADTAMQGPCLPKGKAKQWCTGDHIVQLRGVHLKTGTPDFGRDIDHSHRGFRIECQANADDVCQMDGFDLIGFGQNGRSGPAMNYAYRYVYRNEVAPYWALAHQYALADKMFLTDTASSFIAHQLILSGTVRYNGRSSLTDQPATTPWGCDAPRGDMVPLLLWNGYEKYDGVFPCFTQYGTIADLLDAKNVSYLFYVMQGLDETKPFYDFSGAAWNGFDAIKKFRYGMDWKTHISTPNTNIFKDLKSGNLPSVSWVIPKLFDSDHPAAGCNGGPRWVTRVMNAVGTSRYWKNTVVILLWDDWGGWYDPVPPPQINYTSLGMRIPMILISPYAKPHYISRTNYQYGSILKYVEDTFDLGSLGTTDATANSLDDSFDYRQTPNVFHPAPVPGASKCAGKETPPGVMQEIIEHDGGVPG